MALPSLRSTAKVFHTAAAIDPPASIPSVRGVANSDQRKNYHRVLSSWLASAGLVIALFVIDLQSPLGYAVCMLYAVPILITRLMPDLSSTIITTAATVSLTWIGAVLSPGAIAQHDSPNRAMATALMLGTAWILVTQKQSARQIKAAQQARHASEERLRLFIEHAPVALAMFDRDMRYLAVSRRWITDYDLADKQVVNHSHYEIFPDIPGQWKVAHKRGLAGEIVREEEDRFERADGSERWLCWEVRPWQMQDERVGGIIIFTEDITERKKAEGVLLQNQRVLSSQRTQLQELTGKLLMAQEQERKRIARDLHDDFTQRLAALTIDLQRLSVQAAESNEPHSGYLKQLGNKTEQLTTELQEMAHQLHSSLLEHVGLEAATREFLQEFSARTRLTTEIVVRGLPSTIPITVATCLYRVLKESLQNVKKHAEATNVLVRLLRTGQGVDIYVYDDGVGFDRSQEATSMKGLGLTSMAERVKALHGMFHVRSTSGEGTEVHAWVPLSEVTTDS